LALAGIVVLFAGILGVGLIARKVGGLSLALLCAGIVAGWGAFAFGSVEEAIRATQKGSFFPMLAAEGFVLTLLAAGVSLLLAAPAMRDEKDAPGAKLSMLELLLRVRLSKGTAVLVQCIIVSAIVGGAVTALCSTSTLRGQTVFAAFAGAIAAGVAAQVTAAAAQARLSPAVPVIGMALAAAAAPLIAMGMHGTTLVNDTLAGKLAWIGRPLPIDWAAGSILGVHVGMGWAGATLLHAAPTPQTPGASEQAAVPAQTSKA
jgi:hypothetical protein